jgi:hypothetical protein
VDSTGLKQGHMRALVNREIEQNNPYISVRAGMYTKYIKTKADCDQNLQQIVNLHNAAEI